MSKTIFHLSRGKRGGGGKKKNRVRRGRKEDREKKKEKKNTTTTIMMTKTMIMEMTIRNKLSLLLINWFIEKKRIFE